MPMRGWNVGVLILATLCTTCEQRTVADDTPNGTAAPASAASETSSTWMAPEPVPSITPEKPATTSAASSPAPTVTTERPPWCGRITIPELPKSDREALINEFEKRNPREREDTPKSETRVDYFIAHSGLLKPPNGPGAPATAAAAERQALELIRKNADLLGFTPAELKTAHVWTRAATPGNLMAWEVWLRGFVPRKGYETFPTVSKRIAISVGIRKEGGMFLSRGGGNLPPFKLCTTAPLSPKSPMIANAVIGLEVHNEVGKSIGRVEHQDIGRIEKAILVELSYPGSREFMLSLTYAVPIHKGLSSLPMWTAYVDAKYGLLLAFRENFVT